ncbi:unnamed protein product [Hydatigera taeniaeformis]|uniref:Uncharacterized protein n=1 Tax=Hydatigena taeniaeformis TaxID=6205 RepID=A0A0R3X9S6_HYDTA|nr:unnamed protein product [Hydatigera taeniaeformis]
MAIHNHCCRQDTVVYTCADATRWQPGVPTQAPLACTIKWGAGVEVTEDGDPISSPDERNAGGGGGGGGGDGGGGVDKRSSVFSQLHSAWLECLN